MPENPGPPAAAPAAPGSPVAGSPVPDAPAAPGALPPGGFGRLDGLTAAVIGGTGVLGGSFCRALAADGADVWVMGRSAERGEAAAAGIRAAGGAARFLPVDVTDRASVDAARERLAAEGGLDVLVNAPGVNSATPFEDIREEEWASLIDTNLGSVFRVCQSFRPLLSGRPRGASIVNISSASSGPPLSRVLSYGVAKAGVNNLTQYLARELAPEGIRVNAILPGFFPAEQNRRVLTPERVAAILGHTPMGRLGEPHELDGALLLLADPAASSFITGSLLRVDGGFTAMTI